MEFYEHLHPVIETFKITIMKRAILILVIAVLFAAIAMANETRVISGTISDETGLVLPGVSVVVDKTSHGTISDINGNYSISVQPGNKYLVFSFVGMKTQKVRIPRIDTLNVTLENSDAELEEVVVVGYGSQAKMNFCGAVPRLKKGTMHSFQAMYAPSVDWNTENYSTIHENGYKNARSNPLSTFSIDVDNASYSNVRRYINQGSLPPTDAVRIEEMINYFNYDYKTPTGDHPFSVNTELAKCPWNKEHYLMHIGLQAKRIDKSELPASNLVFLLDVSGSMEAHNKLPLLKRAFKMLVNELRPSDRVAIVVYAGAAGKVLDSTSGDEKKEILDALDKLSAGGSTAGGAGIKLAYKIANDNFIKGGNNRIILATDGDFNVGVSGTSEMERLVEKERENGVFMTVLGFGSGNIKDDKMETIADKGNGNYAYIDNIQEARKVFITEFGGTLFTVAKDVKFQLEFNPEHVKAYRLVGYENRLLNDEDFNDDTKDAGEMGAGHTVTALYEIIPTTSNENAPLVDPLKYQNSETKKDKSGELLTIKLRYKAPDGKTSTRFELPVIDKLEKTTSNNFRFSAAVASFGMLLRNSEFLGDSNIETIVDLARSGKGVDEEGYRSEFIQLVKTVDDLHLLAKSEK